MLDGQFRTFFAKKYIGAEADPNFYQEDILKICRLFNVTALGADSGDGIAQNTYFKLELGPNKVIVFKAHDSVKKPVQYNEPSREWTFNRTKALGHFFTSIKRKKVKFPTWELFKPFAQDILAVYIDYRSRSRDVYYDHAEDMPDDFVHAWVNSYLSFSLVTGRSVEFSAST